MSRPKRKAQPTERFLEAIASEKRRSTSPPKQDDVVKLIKLWNTKLLYHITAGTVIDLDTREIHGDTIWHPDVLLPWVLTIVNRVAGEVCGWCKKKPDHSQRCRHRFRSANPDNLLPGALSTGLTSTATVTDAFRLLEDQKSPVDVWLYHYGMSMPDAQLILVRQSIRNALLASQSNTESVQFASPYVPWNQEKFDKLRDPEPCNARDYKATLREVAEAALKMANEIPDYLPGRVILPSL